MNNLEILNIVKDFAFEKHKGQVDKGGDDYFNHVDRVANRCKTFSSKVVAYLHDVIEDTDATLDDIKSLGVDDTICEAIITMSKKKNDEYMDYIQRISKNHLSVIVKIADLEDNMDITRLKEISDKDIARLQKYHKAYIFLKDYLE